MRQYGTNPDIKVCKNGLHQYDANKKRCPECDWEFEHSPKYLQQQAEYRAKYRKTEACKALRREQKKRARKRVKQLKGK